MSLDVYLKIPGGSTRPAGPGIFIREHGSMFEISREQWDLQYPGVEPHTVEIEDTDTVYSANITHNLTKMAKAADVYEYLWRPDELRVTHAKQLISPLRNGLARLKADPEKFKAHNPPNGWGTYDGFVSFVEQYLAACEANPTATVQVWR